MYIDTSRGLIRNLTLDRIKINWNKDPVKMDVFLSFLTIEVEKLENHFGSDTGWTCYENKERKLIVYGGYVNRIEWLDNLQYGEKLSNPHNNYVNPFYLWDIFTGDGKEFFLKYYKEEIEEIKSFASKNIDAIEKKLEKAEHERDLILESLASLEDF